MTRTQLLTEIFKLDENEQVLLAHAIHEHLVNRDAPVDEPAFKGELDRRIQHADAHPTDDLPWDQLSRRLRAL